MAELGDAALKLVGVSWGEEEETTTVTDSIVPLRGHGESLLLRGPAHPALHDQGLAAYRLDTLDLAPGDRLRGSQQALDVHAMRVELQAENADLTEHQKKSQRTQEREKTTARAGEEYASQPTKQCHRREHC